MPKSKVRLKEEKKNYLCIAVGMFLSIICILIIGRVDGFNVLYLLMAMIFGDFVIFIFIFTIFFCIKDLILNKKVDLHHISFLGIILVYTSISTFAHMGLYDALAMTNKTVLTKTVGLYSRYFKYYEHSFSCGGGIIVAFLLQIIIFIGGKIGAYLFAMGSFVVGVSYIMDLKLLLIFKGGRFKVIPMRVYKGVVSYFKNMHYTKATSKSPKLALSILRDSDEAVNFTLQHEINRENFEKLKNYIKANHIYCVGDSFYTSYTSSRFVVKLAHKSESALSELSSYFNKCCFFIKDDLLINIEVSNQFKKLLTLKNFLVNHNSKSQLPLAIDVNNQIIEFDISKGHILCIIGDPTSGIKTLIRSLLSTLFFKGYNPRQIYFYDLYNEFNILSGSKVHYINNEKSTSISFDEAFEEYERRSDVLKYLNVETISEANKAIEQMGNEYEKLEPIFHFIFFDSNKFDSSLLQKLSYVMQFGVKVGMIIFIILKNKNGLSKINLENSDILALYLNDVSTSIKLFGSDIACRLQKKGDVLYQSQNRLFHGQTPYVSLDDFEKIINHL